ncbi:MAG: dihydroxy-acid dehydratase, partial [Actinobacteria bacterium]|nr:dihydroxy-acid dehydratase [Actinomycetota bacterium]
SQSGVISFRRPKDMAEHDINGVVKKWIRIRIEKGDYGEQGNYSLDGDKWIFKDERPLRPPALRSLNFRYREDYRDVRHALAFNDFQYTDVTEVARTEFTIFQPFQAKPEESPALYMGFPIRPPNDALGLYFHLDEELGLGSVPTDEAEIATGELEKYEAMRRLSWETGQRIVWEYWDGREWEPLTIDDETHQISVALTDDELFRRRAEWQAPPFKAKRGALWKYIQLVQDASHGCVTDE